MCVSGEQDSENTATRFPTSNLDAGQLEIETSLRCTLYMLLVNIVITILPLCIWPIPDSWHMYVCMCTWICCEEWRMTSTCIMYMYIHCTCTQPLQACVHAVWVRLFPQFHHWYGCHCTDWHDTWQNWLPFVCVQLYMYMYMYMHSPWSFHWTAWTYQCQESYTQWPSALLADSV